MPSPLKDPKILALVIGLFLLADAVIAVAIWKSLPPDTVVFVNGVPMKEVPIEPIPGSPTILEPVDGAYGGSPTNELACEDAGGAWVECGSACRNEPDAQACIEVCVSYCECKTSAQCPNDADNISRLTCKEFVNGIGVCK